MKALSEPWTMKPCFEGPDCWCRIIVDPDGEECNNYGDLCRDNCQYIIDALNRTPGAESNINERHPTPWHVGTTESGYKYVVTTDGLDNDEMEYTVSCAGQIRKDCIGLFVEAVNEFYGEKK